MTTTYPPSDRRPRECGPCDRVRRHGGGVLPFDPARDCATCYLWHTRAEVNRAWGGDGNVLPVRDPGGGTCRHLGGPTGRSVGCPTCAGRVELKTFGCAAYGECTTGRPAPGVACCVGCGRREGRSGPTPASVLDAEALWPGEPGVRTNGSLLADGGGYVVAAGTGRNSDVLLGRLGPDLRPLGPPIRPDLDGEGAESGREDPRLLRVGGAVQLWFCGVRGDGSGETVGSTQQYAVLNADLSAAAVYRPARNPPPAPPPQWEKNWSPFDVGGVTHAVYSVNPHVVIVLEGGRVTAEYESADALPGWAGGVPRGGAPPVRVGDEFWHFFHDRVNPRGRDGRCVYRTGIYTFDAVPPFAPRRYHPSPVLVGDPATNGGGNPADNVFTNGAVREPDGSWLLCSGEHDRQLVFHRLAHDDLERSLVSVAAPRSRPVRVEAVPPAPASAPAVQVPPTAVVPAEPKPPPVQPVPPRPPTKWSYGVTTTRVRRDDLLPRTLKSLAAAGFPAPHLFVDGADDGYSWSREFGLDVTCRGGGPVRTHGNWVLSAYELFVREPDAARYAVFQDDLVCVRNLRQYLEKSRYPGPGYLNLYTFPSNTPPEMRRHGLPAPDDSHVGWYRSNQNGRGAVALVFDRDSLLALLGSEHLLRRPLDCTRGWRAVDGGIVESYRKLGMTEWVHAPSLVQHTGDVSSMGNRPHPKSPTFPGEHFDVLTLLGEVNAKGHIPPGVGEKSINEKNR